MKRRSHPVLAWLLVLLFTLCIGFGGCFIIQSTLHRMIYPLEYQEYVMTYAAEYQVEPELVYAIIRTESNFDPHATSGVGARGLMQLMNEAFLWVQRTIKDPKVSYDDMYDPQQNIRYGTCLLSLLLREFGGNVNNAIMAYHAGQGAVSDWLSDVELPKETTLPEAQSPVTQAYLNKVLTNMKMYQEMKIRKE